MDHSTPSVHLGPIVIDLTILSMSLLTVVLTFGFIFWASRKMTLRPSGKQNVLEYAYEFVYGVAKGNLGESYSRKYLLFLFSLFMFLLIGNNIGLVTKLESASGENLWMSPTANMMFDFGLSLIVTVFCHAEGIRQRGFKAYLKAFVTPAYMTPMNIIEEFANFLSLALRLYGNIFAGEVLIGLLVQLSHSHILWQPVSVLLTILWIAFSVFVSCLQAYVFTMLTSLYLSNKVNGHGH
ncbi:MULTISPECIES: F0F1 ATP synthase subunit A [Streptococcus]|uniref:ATP synthase subunit a n=1 Tax=Streptococcus caledonicus TaxID=2614158 RepID=A0ABW0UEU5_9STRE|nr:F0F1 ATP synthase subunit A [Streptococcus sp. S784/96/1]